MVPPFFLKPTYRTLETYRGVFNKTLPACVIATSVESSLICFRTPVRLQAFLGFCQLSLNMDHVTTVGCGVVVQASRHTSQGKGANQSCARHGHDQCLCGDRQAVHARPCQDQARCSQKQEEEINFFVISSHACSSLSSARLTDTLPSKVVLLFLLPDMSSICKLDHCEPCQATVVCDGASEFGRCPSTLFALSYAYLWQPLVFSECTFLMTCYNPFAITLLLCHCCMVGYTVDMPIAYKTTAAQGT